MTKGSSRKNLVLCELLGSEYKNYTKMLEIVQPLLESTVRLPVRYVLLTSMLLGDSVTRVH